ncbi:alpha/beta hydrolase [Streptomyces laculatispora]|uniref:alpha/beta hydrolase n=1 Tax=Streptomyces laculatispora TaxID=887464 RepID=UPI001A952F81|nr:alpha/beta hydrolase [Streptomyces laculatispora]MBO0915141.1 alpha/beta hydrolase [Streptomyces laculatispora]
MTTYVLIPGAASDSWYWHLLKAELCARGHDVVAADLPCDDDSAGLAEYADVVIDAIGDRTGLVVVAHSFGGFTAPLVCDRVPVELLVLMTAMIPSPGEPASDWWANTGWEQARHKQDKRDGRAPGDDTDLFLHDVPPELAAEAKKRSRDQSGTPFVKPWPLAAWPPVSTKFLLCRDDRFFPAEFMRRIVRERLGIVPDEIDGGHSVALSRPKELADRLEAYQTDVLRHPAKTASLPFQPATLCTPKPLTSANEEVRLEYY